MPRAPNQELLLDWYMDSIGHYRNALVLANTENATTVLVGLILVSVDICISITLKNDIKNISCCSTKTVAYVAQYH